MLKSFDKIEKDAIKRLVSEKQSGQPIRLGNVLDTLFPNQYIKIDKAQSKVDIMYDNSGQTSQVVEDQGVLATIILLMNYLEKNGYICLFDCANVQATVSTIGQGAQSKCTISHSLPDQNVSNWLLNNCDKQIIVGYDLVKLVKDDFISKDELRFKKQQIATWVSIIISLLIGLCGIFMNLVTLQEENSDMTVKNIDNYNNATCTCSDKGNNNSVETFNVNISENCEDSILSVK